MTLNTASRRPLVMRVDLPEQQPDHDGKETARPRLDLLEDVRVTVDIRLGCAELTVKELMALQAGSVVELDRQLGDTIEVRLNEKTIAHAEIVAVGEQFGVRITDISASQ
ncbi:flagellar motor switch protein FliN [Paraburkholderia terricola]|uniref:Flagellar motor switch protein FliN n=1 Tax=Paraburkholderia terricola TaxID=169427 RepID=A0ABU1LXR9_9BURK|nr:flagellar motor switch protein FliN [Paraburkholderia terricola]MDR6411320.1 flagellar motor switch protein FliN/FliY [Paraburkholderia terricola]MDR6483440.1 flagellar motor switch protein FliN/FliY [Paraburkholderia terricola]